MTITTTTTQAVTNVTVPATILVPVTIARATVATIEAHVGKMPDDTLVYLFHYGLRQCLNDAKAGEDDPKAAQGLMEKRLARLMSGEFGTRGASVTETDPVRAEALKMALKTVKDAVRKRIATKAIGGKLADYADAIAKNASELVDRDPSYMAQARIIVAARSNVTSGASADGGFVLDLASLGLTPAVADGAEPDGATDQTPATDGDGTEPVTDPTSPATNSAESDLTPATDETPPPAESAEQPPAPAPAPESRKGRKGEQNNT